MIDPKNYGTIEGTVVADPELNDKKTMAKIRLAVNYAGNDRENPENKTGFFRLTAFSNNTNLAFMFKQIDAGNIKKGSTVQFIYKLNHSRYKNNEGKAVSSVEMIAEGFSYAGGGRSKTEETKASAPASNTNVPDEF